MLRAGTDRYSLSITPAADATPIAPPIAGSLVADKVRASLIVVGSCGLSGVKALGSVSERVAHHAPCSVLAARRPAPPIEERFDRWPDS